jgi:HAD superfamily hydrolase (TIGR01549 family)
MIFDVDGTLVDSVDSHAQAWQEAFRQSGHEISFDEIRSQIGKGGDQLMPVFLSENEIDERGAQIDEFRSNYLKERLYPQITGFPGVRDLMQTLLARDIAIVLGSSAKKDELSYYKKVCNIDDLIHQETTSDDADRTKPYPDIFVAALKLLPHLLPDQIMVVGDTPYDAVAARKAGLRTVGVLSGGFAEEDLWRAGCLAIFRNPAALLDRLDELALR